VGSRIRLFVIQGRAQHKFKTKFHDKQILESKSGEVFPAPHCFLSLFSVGTYRQNFKIKLIIFAARQPYSTIHAARDSTLVTHLWIKRLSAEGIRTIADLHSR